MTEHPALAGLRKVFAGPTVPLVNAPVESAQMLRYSRTDRDTAVFMAQSAMMLSTPHRMLVGPEIQEYVDEVLAMPWPRWRTGRQWPVMVRIVHGLTASNGTALYKSGTIFVPPVIEEIIVLHELAHHLSPVVSDSHGDAFVAAFLDLVEHVMNEAAAVKLRGCLATEGISA